MFSTFGLLEPNNDLQIAYFGCVIALYFLSFFYDHPVYKAECNITIYAFQLLHHMMDGVQHMMDRGTSYDG